MAIDTLRKLRRYKNMGFNWSKVSVSASAAMPFSLFNVGGFPVAGTLAGTSVAAGVVPTDATTGAPIFYPEVGTEEIKLGFIRMMNAVPARVYIYDLLWKAGAYAFNANQALAAQPSFAARLPGTDYNTVEMWMECVTTFTGNPAFIITYLDGGGVSRTATGGSPSIAFSSRRMHRFGLQAGTFGVSQVNNVLCATATVGTFNILLMRRLWQGRINVGGVPAFFDHFKTGAVQFYADSCLYLVVQPDASAATGPTVFSAGYTVDA